MKANTWHRRNPRLAAILIFTILLFLLLFAAEIYLRKNGWQPGKLIKNYDSFLHWALQPRPGFLVDSNGIYKADTTLRSRIAKQISLNQPFGNDKVSGTLSTAVRDFADPKFNSLPSEFPSYVQQLLRKPGNSLSEFEKIVLDYRYSLINEAGFRSISFRSFQTKRKKVMLLGDSFTWGMMADPIYNCFADRLLSRGYVVFNFGIAATDPAQYLAIAQQYIPLLKPDVVIINFFMGNDQMDYKRIAEPYRATFYDNGMGCFEAFINGCYLSAEKTVELNVSYFSIPNQDKNFANRWLAKTTLGTRLWKVLAKMSLVESRRELPECLPRHNPPVSSYYTEEIKRIAMENEAKTELVLIPFNQSWDTFKEEAKWNFDTLPYHEVKSILTLDDFAPNDDHFNNEGHRKYADFLEKLINQEEEN